jgi:1,4-dihydroxy-6-naphthoate synthase
MSIGFSPCPNDTYIFNGLVHNHVGIDGVDLQPEVLADVETLNEWALEGRLDVTKLSFHALGHVTADYVMLRSGSALGFGCGPLLVAGRTVDRSRLSGLTVAIPGRYTTAAALLKMYAPTADRLVVMRFDEIMPAIADNRVDCGVIIHESRFTYRQAGLRLVEDLGAWWETETGCAIPLGCIAAKRSLGREVIARVDAGVRASVRWARLHPDRLDYIRQHAQELDDKVIQEHIRLYVTRFTEDIGAEGMAAVETFLARGREAGLLSPAAENLTGGEICSVRGGAQRGSNLVNKG